MTESPSSPIEWSDEDGKLIETRERGKAMRNQDHFHFGGSWRAAGAVSAYVYRVRRNTTVTSISARLQPLCAGNFCHTESLRAIKPTAEKHQHLPGCFGYVREILVAEGEM